MSKKRLVVLIDSGDTLIDEGTEVRDERGLVIRGDYIPGAPDAIRALSREGYALAMVADGRREAFVNLHEKSGVWALFDHIVDSETVGAEKPDARMFQAAMDRLGLHEADRRRVIMIGNNLERDIAGANRFGIRSVFQTWTPRYRQMPQREDERPTYTVKDPSDWPALCARLESELAAEG